MAFSWKAVIGLYKATFFLMLFLHHTTLLKMFIRAKCFLIKFLGSFKYRIMSSANKSTQIQPIHFCSPCISFCHFTALAESSSTILSKMERVSIFASQDKILSFFPVQYNGHFRRNLYIYDCIEVFLLFCSFLRDFIKKGCWTASFFCICISSLSNIYCTLRCITSISLLHNKQLWNHK